MREFSRRCGFCVARFVLVVVAAKACLGLARDRLRNRHPARPAKSGGRGRGPGPLLALGRCKLFWSRLLGSLRAGIFAHTWLFCRALRARRYCRKACLGLARDRLRNRHPARPASARLEQDQVPPSVVVSAFGVFFVALGCGMWPAATRSVRRLRARLPRPLLRRRR